LTALYLGIFGFSLTLSFVFTRYIRNLATARGWVSAPVSERHLHAAPLPRLGGVAIFSAFVLSVAVAVAAASFRPHLSFGSSLKILVTILVPACLIFLLGLYDDIRSTGPYVKFAVQAVAAAMLWMGGLRILDLPVLFGSRQFPWFVGLVLTIVWVLGITNAFNLIDGLDGLAAGSALFSTLVVFVVSLLSHSSLVALMTLALTGAIVGFLRFNFNPATIFLGDSGSLFIGFMLSALALEGAQKAPTVIAVAIPVVSFGLPILETSLSVLRRLISGRPVFTADREHIHHKLLQLGLSHREVVIVLYAVSALFALLSLFLLWPTGSSLGLVLAVVGTGVSHPGKAGDPPRASRGSAFALEPPRQSNDSRHCRNVGAHAGVADRFQSPPGFYHRPSTLSGASPAARREFAHLGISYRSCGRSRSSHHRRSDSASHRGTGRRPARSTSRLIPATLWAPIFRILPRRPRAVFKNAHRIAIRVCLR